MQKTELVFIVAQRAGISQSKAEDGLSAAASTIMGCIRDGEPVSLAGFGMFKPKKRSAKQAWNINTMTRILVPPRIDPVFIPGVEFKNIMKEVNIDA